MGQRRRFPPEFKQHAVQLLNAGHRPAAEIARELGIPRNRLYKWQKEVAGHGGAMMSVGVMGIIYRAEKRFILIEPDSLLMIVGYVLGMGLIFRLGG